MDFPYGCYNSIDKNTKEHAVKPSFTDILKFSSGDKAYSLGSQMDCPTKMVQQIIFTPMATLPKSMILRAEYLEPIMFIWKKKSKTQRNWHCELCNKNLHGEHRLARCEFCDRILCQDDVLSGVPQPHQTTCRSCLDFFAINTKSISRKHLPTILSCNLCRQKIDEQLYQSHCEFCNRILCEKCVQIDTPQPYLTTCKMCKQMFSNINFPIKKTDSCNCSLCNNPYNQERWKIKCSFCEGIFCHQCVFSDTPVDKVNTCKACAAIKRFKIPTCCEICARPFEGRKYGDQSKRCCSSCYSCNRWVCNQCIEGQGIGTCTECQKIGHKTRADDFSTGVKSYEVGACYYCGVNLKEGNYKERCSFCYRPSCSDCVVRDTPDYSWQTCKNCITNKRIPRKVSKLKASNKNSCEICLQSLSKKFAKSCNFCQRVLCTNCVEPNTPEPGIQTCKNCLKRYTIPALKQFFHSSIEENTYSPIRNLCAICEQPFDDNSRLIACCYYCQNIICSQCSYQSMPALPYQTCHSCIGKIRSLNTTNKQCDICQQTLSEDIKERFKCNFCDQILCSECVHNHVPERYKTTCKACINKVKREERKICELCSMNLTTNFYSDKGTNCDFCSRVVCYNCVCSDPQKAHLKRCQTCMKDQQVSCENCGLQLSYNKKTGCDFCNRILCSNCVFFDTPDHHQNICKKCVKSIPS